MVKASPLFFILKNLFPALANGQANVRASVSVSVSISVSIFVPIPISIPVFIPVFIPVSIPASFLASYLFLVCAAWSAVCFTVARRRLRHVPKCKLSLVATLQAVHTQALHSTPLQGTEQIPHFYSRFFPASFPAFAFILASLCPCSCSCPCPCPCPCFCAFALLFSAFAAFIMDCWPSNAFVGAAHWAARL